jgi:type I restriction enzyme R subunit
MKWTSPNFAFLEPRDPLLHGYASRAERYFSDDPNGSLVKMRQFAEALTHATAANFGNPASTETAFIDVLRGLDYRVPERIVNLLHDVRKLGNRATHAHADEHRDALTALKVGHQLGVWFHATFRAKGFKPSPFVIPPNPADATAALLSEMEAIRAEAAEAAAKLASLEGTAAELERLKAEAEIRSSKAFEDLDAALDLASQAEEARKSDRQHFEAELASIRGVNLAPPTPAAVEELAAVAAVAAEAIDLDEVTTRKLIDEQLRQAGWDADTQALRWSAGTRPQKGRNLAIAEVPTASGPVDYVLFRGLLAVAVVEAKRGSVDVPGVLSHQAQRYARDICANVVGSHGPWGEYRVPFAFATNGRPYLEQVKTKSGVWFRDLRIDTNLARALVGWWTPEGLEAALGIEPEKAMSELQKRSFDDLGLYDFQIDTVRKVEAAIAAGRRSILVAMATGTGKTRTALGFIYRALEAKRFRRVLFLVDRTSLGDQTFDVIGHMSVDGRQTIKTVYDVKGMAEAAPAGDTRLQLATIQGLVRRVLYSDDPPPVDQYDLIVVDECHRGYSLDRDMSDGQLTFRSEADYISKYRRVLDYFDAVKVGLTATPALHTSQIFGHPVATYSYRQAVIDGRLIDHEPPICIVTELAEDGFTWKKAQSVPLVHLKTGQLDSEVMADDTKVEVDSFNTRVLVPAFNDTVCEELANHLDPALPGKTLVFCARDDHADLVVQTLKEKLTAKWGPIPDALVQKVTGRTDDPGKAIRLYKNEHNPKIVVTVDLLTTGIDVPAIVNLVFLRRVRSRILYEQMLGRATRRCDPIGKEVFRIYDCVDIYAALEDFSTMRPVVRNQTGTFRAIIEDLAKVKDPVIRQGIHEEFLAIWQRRKRKLVGPLLAAFEDAVGVQVGQVAGRVKSLTVDEASDWLTEHIEAFAAIDETKGLPSDPTMYLETGPDGIRRVVRGYGAGRKPADYLEGFKDFISTNLNELPALMVVLKRPRDLTRKELKELALALDTAGYGELSLRVAWKDLTTQDIGATIIGHIRRAALGSPLLPYEERVDKAYKAILARKAWSKPQREWLLSFANQLKKETVLDREALNSGIFQVDGGGYTRLDRVFDGHLGDVLAEMTEALWTDAA